MRQRYTVVVEHPIETVFAFLADPRNMVTWIDPVSEVTLVGEDEQADPATAAIEEGAGFRQRVGPAEDPAVMHEGTIARHEPPEHVAFRFETESGHLSTGFELEDASGGTRVTETVEVPLTRWSTKLLAPFLWWANRRRLKEHLSQLETALQETTEPR